MSGIINVYCIICKYVSDACKKRMKEHRLMKLIIKTNLYFFCLYQYCNIMLCVVFLL